MNQAQDNSKLIRVLVTDDSAFMRTAITRMIESDPGLRVLGGAQTGQEALQKIAALKPDVVTLDVEMPGMNGLETLKHIMKEFPLPVIMVSSLTTEGAETTLEALDIGAFDYVPKQSSFVSLDIIKIRDDLINKVKAAAESVRRRPMARVTRAETSPATFPAHLAPKVTPTIVALGTSTGGTEGAAGDFAFISQRPARASACCAAHATRIYWALCSSSEWSLQNQGAGSNSRGRNSARRSLYCTRWPAYDRLPPWIFKSRAVPGIDPGGVAA
jgi:chemotaxis response regulator CheB